jgi:signal transduction histidine kinase
MSRRLLVVLGVAGAAATATAIALVVLGHGFDDFPAGGLAQGVVNSVLSGIWIATGLIAWQRRPDNRVGPLMTAIGFLAVAQDLYWDAAVPFTIALHLPSLQFPMIVHLFVAFPDGRLETRFERGFVRFCYAANLLPWLVLALVWDPHIDWPYIPPDGPDNLLLVDRNPAVSEAMNTIVFFVWIGMFVTLAVLLVTRVGRARGPTRRAVAPVAVSAAVTVVLFTAATIADTAGAEIVAVVLESLTSVAFGAIPVAFLVGLLRTRLHRSAVADLVISLHRPLTPTQVRDAIAGTLRDESLELAFWLPDRDWYVGPDGAELDPKGQPGRAVTILEGDSGRLAALIHDPTLLDDDPALIDAVGAAASLALENARLQAELSTQLNEVRASRARIVEAGDAERRRIERDLHDGAQQRLLGIRLALQLVRGRLADSGAALDGLLTEADGEVVSALDELRALARGIHPALLTDEGLDAALTALARRVPLPVDLHVCHGRLAPLVEATAYFVASEALANVVKHAHATRATIDISRANGCVAIEIRDDGVGGADPVGAGLKGLRDRVEAVDGHLRVDSVAGHGTRVTAEVPCG